MDISAARPALFLSHGGPTLAVVPSPAYDFLKRLGSELGKPKAIVVVSAHYETHGVRVSAAERPETIHDFYGFPPELYQIRYPAPGAPELAAEIVELARAAGLEAGLDADRGLDHGTWVPFLLMYPDADVPVVSISVDTDAGPAHTLALGRALAPLRDRDILVIGSGAFTHNLGARVRGRMDAESPAWVTDFVDWARAAIKEGRVDDLVDYRRRSPHGADNHPTEEHILPLFAAIGAAGGAPGRSLHESVQAGVLAMDTFSFG